MNSTQKNKDREHGLELQDFNIDSRLERKAMESRLSEMERGARSYEYQGSSFASETERDRLIHRLRDERRSHGETIEKLMQILETAGKMEFENHRHPIPKILSSVRHPLMNLQHR